MNSEDNPGGSEDENDLPPGEKIFRKEFEEGFEKGFKLGLKKGSEKDDQQGAKEKPEEGGKSKEDKDKKEQEKEEPKQPVYKKHAFIIVASIIVILLLVGGIILRLILRQYVSTDDAYIDGHVTQVSPRASAQVLFLHVRDNELVHQGDLLVELDPTDYQVALDQAVAQVASSQGRLMQAKAQIETAKADVAQAIAAVDAAQVQLDNATRDLKRYEEVDERARSREQLDDAQTTQKNAQAQLEQAQAKKASADANVQSSEASVAAAEGELQTSQASQKRAEVNLSYCKIFAPTDGRVTQRTVEVGNYVAVGQALFMLADPRVWVTANYKETQLQHMRIGQPVTIKVDAYPGAKWHGHVDSLQAGSGSRFSILPAENATGNYVKVVQRIPVKILFDDPVNTNDDILFSAGMSVIPRVKVR
jgi:membrane fusion protein (multidrug efflux system)